jgi:predicted regulator of Ras-like GTPase activity (Roadblock/LC7/MglB family)
MSQAPEEEADLEQLGVLLRPAFRKMVSRIPHVRGALICTPDGFNVCSVGVAENLVGKMAALSSSLQSLGDAMVSNFVWDTANPGDSDFITVEANGTQIVSTSINGVRQPVVVMACARTSLGVILVNVKAACVELRELLV